MITNNLQVARIPLSKLRTPKVALRGAKKSAEAYAGLLASIRQHGVQQSLLVLKHEDEDLYTIVNGLQRYTATKEILDTTNAERQERGEPPIPESEITLPVMIETDPDAAAALALQFQLNFHNVPTTPLEYAAHIQRWLASGNMTRTHAEAAAHFSLSPTQVSQLLKLNTLTNEAKTLLNDGDMTLANAIWLAKLPQENQEEFLDRATTMTLDNFGAQVANRLAELKKLKSGERVDPGQFVPTAKIRSKSDLVKRLQTHFDDVMGAPSPLVLENIATGTPEYNKGFHEAMLWVLSLDEASIANQKAEHDQIVAARLRKQQEKKLAKDLEGAEVSKQVNLFGRKDVVAVKEI